jgi:hypothetical protein
LDSIEGRLLALEARLERGAVGGSAFRAPRRVRTAGSRWPVLDDIPAAAERRTGEPGSSHPVSVAAGEVQGLRQLIDAALEERERGLRAQEEEIARRVAEFSEGPYDTFNLQVNAMGAYLDLSQEQKDSYCHILATLMQRWEEDLVAIAGSAARDEEEEVQLAAQQEAVSEAVNRQYEEEVLALLSSRQRERFLQLTQEERSLDGASLVAFSHGAGVAP